MTLYLSAPSFWPIRRPALAAIFSGLVFLIVQLLPTTLALAATTMDLTIPVGGSVTTIYDSGGWVDDVDSSPTTTTTFDLTVDTQAASWS